MKKATIVYRIKRALGILKPKDIITFLRKQGVKIGKGTVLFDTDITIDAQRPWMIEIGEYCKITKGCIILQHDYSRSVLRRKYGRVIGESQKTIIGDNVFIGVNSVVLMGTTIGNDVVVGAGSVVRGKIPDGVVIAGNPARIICTLDEYKSKREKRCIDEAKNTAIEFYTKYGRIPSEREMGAFWPLFSQKNISRLREKGIFTNLSGDEEEEIISYWIADKAPFDSYDEFLYYCGLQSR